MVMNLFSSFSAAIRTMGLYIVPATLTFSHCVGSVYRVQGSSMKPNINPSDDARCDDFVFVTHFGIKKRELERGDVVSFYSIGGGVGGRSLNEYHIKRVVGLPGDVVQTCSYKLRQVIVPQGYLWIEGDNKRTSLDCNSYGPLPRGLLFGRAAYIIWPPHRMGPVKQIPPSPQKVKPAGSKEALAASAEFQRQRAKQSVS